MVPLVSWLALRGRCRTCQQPIGWFAPAVELAAVLVVLWGASVVTNEVLIATCVFGWTLLALGLIDVRRFLLPDSLCILLALEGLAATFLLVPQNLVSHLVGGGLNAWGLSSRRLLDIADSGALAGPATESSDFV